jgi:hypothetical protein
MSKERQKVSIGGIPAIIGTPEECERAQFVVCGTISAFVDDVHTTCTFCETPIVHRPCAPLTPPKICLRCFITFIQTQES